VERCSWDISATRDIRALFSDLTTELTLRFVDDRTELIVTAIRLAHRGPAFNIDRYSATA